jgi:hypothetical protein
MMITKTALPRRSVLRGMGAAVALPVLDAMVPALTAFAKTPAAPVRRLGVVYVPNGMIMPAWTPSADGALDLSPILQPLAPFKDRMLVFSGLDGMQNRGGTHTTAATRFLTGGVGKRTAQGIEAGTSIDQIAAQQFGRDTQLASLELSLDRLDLVGTCDNTTCAFINSLSWTSPTTQAPAEDNPRVVFERLFGEGGNAAQRLARMRKTGSILDSVTQQVARLEQTLGPGDRTKLSEYLEAVRAVEQRIERAEQNNADVEVPLPERPTGIPDTFDEHAKLMFDLQLLAFQADITRVVSLMMARELSNRSYPEIGVPDGHHTVSHHQDDLELLAKKAKVDTYHIELLGYWLERLRATSDGDGSLLDQAMILYGSGLGDGNQHDHHRLPALLAGGAAGRLQGGRHLQYPETPMTNLLLTMLEKVGVPMESLGDSTGRLDLSYLADI